MYSLMHKYSSPTSTPSSILNKKPKPAQQHRTQGRHRLSSVGDDDSVLSYLNKYSSPMRSTSFETTKNTKYDYSNRKKSSEYHSPLGDKSMSSLLNKYTPSSRSSPLAITRNTKYDYTNRKKDNDFHSPLGDNSLSSFSRYSSSLRNSSLEITKNNNQRKNSDLYSPPGDRGLNTFMDKYTSPTRSSLLDITKSTKYESQNRRKDNGHYSPPGDRGLNTFMDKYLSPTKTSLLDITKSTKYESQNRNKDIDHYSPPGEKSINLLLDKYSSPTRSSLLDITRSTKYESQNRTNENDHYSSSPDSKKIQALMDKYSSPSPVSPPLTVSYPSSLTSPSWSPSLDTTNNSKYDLQDRSWESGYLSSLGDTKRNYPLITDNSTPWWSFKQNFPEINKLVWENDVETLRDLLKSSDLANVTKESEEGCIHLHEAAYYGFHDCLKLLVAAFPELINKRSNRCQTPLLLAVHRKQVQCVECLLRAGADPNLADKLGETPLYVACLRDSAEIVDLLLRAGANATRTTLEGLTPLHEAAAFRNLAICQRLVKSKAKVNARSRYGIEPVFAASQGGCPEVLKFLIEHGANVNASASDGATPLYEAARYGHEEVVEILLEHGADANQLNSTGLTPLHIAAKNGHGRVVALLISYTNLRDLNQSGISPLHLAAECDREDILEILIQARLDVNAMLSPAYSLKYEDRRSTALVFAVRQDNWDAASMLLEAGADPNLDVFNPLLLALSRGDRDMVSLLLEYGANVNATVPTHATTFPGALLFCMNHLSMMKLLLDHGCDAASCFDCVYGDHPHPPVKRNRTSGYNLQLHGHEAPHETAVQFCETLADPFNSPWAGPVIDLLLDYVGKVKLCSRLNELLDSNKDWAYIKNKTMPLHSLMHLSRLRIHEVVGRHRTKYLHTLPLPDRLIRFLLYDNSEAEDFINYGFD